MATLPLHGGRAPRWLFEKMVRLSKAIVVLMVEEFGSHEVLRRLSDPFWFQAFGCVLGFDWHSSGVTTTTLGALKEGLRGVSEEIGVFVCGGKGRVSRKTPDEIVRFCERLGLDPDGLIYASRMAAKVDNSALQDGYTLYHHSFIFTRDGRWAVVQQGMKEGGRTARRYHWLSDSLASFVEEPHSAICAEKREGRVLDLVAKESSPVREFMPEYLLGSTQEIKKDLTSISHLVLPERHYVLPSDLNMDRVLRILERIKPMSPKTFEEFLSIKGVGPRTVRALSLVSELIYGKSPSFKDPARFSFAHGGKDGHPYPVDRNVYERTVAYLEMFIRKVKESPYEKDRALNRLRSWARTG